MSLLLDTHVMVWWLADSAELPQRFVQLVESGAESYVSVASCWELAIKVASGKWPEAAVLFPGLEANLLAAGFSLRPITASVSERAAFLSWPHRDPFDRLLAAEALESEWTLLSVDAAFAAVPGLRLA